MALTMPSPVNLSNSNMSAGVLPPLPTGSSPRSPPENATRNLSSREKRTFKEKLMGLVADAEMQEQQAQRQAQLQDKKTLSIALLIEGRPQAFVEFFELSHSESASRSGHASTSATNSLGASGPAGSAEMPQESLIVMQAELVKADLAARSGSTEGVYNSYKQLAKYFTAQGRLHTAEYFYKQCLHVSRAAGWLPGEIEANGELGSVYEQLHDTRAAIACYEQRLELAGQHLQASNVEATYHSLTAVYLAQAQQQDREGDLAGAIDSYNRCLQCADMAQNVPTAAQAQFRLGLLYKEQGKWQDAMYYLRKFIENSAALGDKTLEGAAHTTYAQCLREIGDLPSAVNALESYLETTSRAQDQSGPATACCSLGILNFEQKKYDQAVTYFEKFFEIARGLSNRHLLETARFNLGVARAAVRMQSYFQIVNNDLPKLIQWKNLRAEF